MTYRPRYGHTARREQIRIRRQLGCQHAIFEIVDEMDQILNLLFEDGLLETPGLVGVNGMGSCACLDLSRHCSFFLFPVSFQSGSMPIYLSTNGVW